MKVLILKPSSLGDVVQALPVLRMLKRHRPDAEVYWWIDSHLAGLLEGDPDLDGLFLFDRRRWGSPGGLPSIIRGIREMRRHRFDWILDLQALARSGIVAWLAGGKVVAGLDDPREGAPAFYDLRVPRRSSISHAVDWNVELGAALGIPVRWDFDWLPARPAARAGIGRRWPVEGGRWILLQPGARWTNKRWPVGHFAALVRQLAVDLDPAVRFAVLGSAGETHLAAEVCAAAPDRCISLAGETSLPEMVEWLRVASLLVTNDTGPMHVAAALGRPVVAVYGPTSPHRTGPYGQVDRVLQLSLNCIPCLKSRCHHRPRIECLTALSPERVAEAVHRRLAEAL